MHPKKSCSFVVSLRCVCNLKSKQYNSIKIENKPSYFIKVTFVDSIHADCNIHTTNSSVELNSQHHGGPEGFLIKTIRALST